MPESADKEDDDGVADCDGGAVAAAAQGYVDVVAEPCCQRYVPAAPEFGYGAREVGEGEVAAQFYAEEARGAYGYVGVAGEVAVDLE